MMIFRCVTSIGYESRKCMQAVQGGLLGGHKSTPVKQPAAPHLRITEDLPGSWPGQYMRIQPLTTQSVGYHSLSGTISFRLQAYYGLLLSRPGQMMCRVKSLCMLVSGKPCVVPHPVTGAKHKHIYHFIPDKCIVHKKVHIYLDYHSISPSSELGPPNPLSRKRVCPPRIQKEGWYTFAFV
jgi:hypothetical protein